MLFMSNGMNLYHITICIGGWMEYTRFTAIHEKCDPYVVETRKTMG